MSQAVVYEYVPVVVEETGEKSVSEAGYVSKYRIVETKYRAIITKLLVTLFSPDMQVVVSRYEVPTRFVETEYTRDTVTVFVGVVKATEQPQPVTTQPRGGGREQVEIHQMI